MSNTSVPNGTGPKTPDGEGLGLSWRDVSWHAKVGGVERKLLHGATGYAAPGQVMAMMGPSGSGKTTLLDVLALRKTLGRVEGNVRFRGRCRRPGLFQRASAYVPHEDVFLPTLTVLETLWYHAEMRMPHGLTPEARRLRFEEVLRLVGLAKAGGTMVGGPLPGGLFLRGLSGGERKRLSLAVAMLPEPAIVFADEPTSGLDTLASLRVVQVLRDVAAGGKVVIMTVHQPRGAVWQLFDSLYLLSEGRLMYAGPCPRATHWFGGVGYKAPADASPADWLLDLVTVGFDKSALGWRACESAAEVVSLSEKFAASDEMARICALVESAAAGVGVWPTVAGTAGGLDRAPPRLAQLRALMWRHALNYYRNAGNVLARLCLALASGLVVGVCYSGLRAADATDPRNLPDKLGALFFVCLVLMITPNCSLALFAGDRRFYVAEAAAQLYGSFSYYAPLAFCELAVNLACAALFWTPVSLLSGMRQEGDSMLCGMLLCGLLQLCGAQVVNVSALLVPNQELAFVVSVAANVFFFVTSGFLVRTGDLVACVRWLRFLSPVKLGFEALALNELDPRVFSVEPQLRDLRLALRQAEGPHWWLRQAPLRDMVGGVLEEALPRVDPCVSGMVSTGREALRCLDLLEQGEIRYSAFGLVAHLAVLHLFGWLCLRHLHKERR